MIDREGDRSCARSTRRVSLQFPLNSAYFRYGACQVVRLAQPNAATVLPTIDVMSNSDGVRYTADVVGTAGIVGWYLPAPWTGRPLLYDHCGVVLR